MADTVKKSRIVSDSDNFTLFDENLIEDSSLQDIINEEFNQRLKSCMVDDNPVCEETENIESNSLLTEPVNNTTSDLNVLNHKDLKDLKDPNLENTLPENLLTDLPECDKKVLSNGNHEIKSLEEICENVEEIQGRFEDEEFVNKEIPSPEEIIDELTPPFENITVTDVDSENLSSKERFLSSVTNLEAENEEGSVDRLSVSSQNSNSSNKPSTVKDRMFLSTDSACLLFTQTVLQSPMLTPNLTPTEENYDFIQALKQREANTSLNQEANNVEILTPIEAINDPDNFEILSKEIDLQKEESIEISAENDVCNQLESSNSENDVSEGSIFKNEEILYEENQEKILTNDIFKKESTLLKTNVKEMSKIFTSSLQKDDLNVNNKEHNLKISPIALEEYPENFETIKKTKEIFEKRCNVKNDDNYENSKRNSNYGFESNNEEDLDSTNNSECSNGFSTTMTSESSFVETRTETSGGSEKILKKKKSKKSKKDNEKENISVNDVITNTNNENAEEILSHVSVKNLCRSFSDLSCIENRRIELSKTRHTYGRAKSMSDIRREETNLENVFSHVSVKNLRECFDNLTNKTASNHVNYDKQLNDHKKIAVKPLIKTSDRIEKLKSSFSKFDALQKKTVLHVRSADSGKAQTKFNGTAPVDPSCCKSCLKQVFQMEQIKAEKAVWHKNCFRCKECNKQLNVDTYQSNEGELYCKPHFKALFTPKAVEEEAQPIRPRKHELIIRENQPEELPPDVVRASDKPDLGLEELQNLNVKERFQVFEHHESQENNLERTPSAINVKRSPSILSKLAKFQQKGMDVGVSDDSLNGVPVEESSSEEEHDDEIDGEDADLIRAKRAGIQREIPLHFNNMSDIMNKWESGNQMTKEERREEKKKEIQSIRSRLFMGKQGKMKELYQQAVAESESGAHVKKSCPLDAEISESARSIKDKFERGESLTQDEQQKLHELEEDRSVFESGISKKSRSIFLELDANASKAPQLTPLSPSKSGTEVRRAREAFMARQASEDVVKATDHVDDVTIKTADISNRFKFFETYKEPEKQRKQFRITPPRDGQVKLPSPDREIYRDPDLVRSSSPTDDTTLPQQTHTATKMLSIFRQMEENLQRKEEPQGLKPLKRFTPPPEGEIRREHDSEDEEETEEDDEEEEADEDDNVNKSYDDDLIEAKKAARAKQLRAKFEKWEINELQREQNNSSVNLAQEIGDESQIESARSLRARFESMRDTNSDKERQPRVKVNRFVDTTNNTDICKSCQGRVYPLEKISCHNSIYHKNCFRCKECNTILRMDSYSYNQGQLYCLTHFKRLFAMKGNYESGFGLNEHKEKWNIAV